MARPAAAPQLLRARWFDGRRSQPRAVHVALVPGRGGPALVLHAPGLPARRFACAEVGWPAAWSARPTAPVVVDLGEAGSLELENAAAWHAARRRAGACPGLAERLQLRWPALLVALLGATLAVALFYRHGTPWLAAQLTRHVPLAWEAALARQALDELDGELLQPSRLPPWRQAALRAHFDALVVQNGALPARYPGYAPRYTLAFRAGMGPNAFALPGGAVVVTDALVEAARSAGLGDEAIAGVLAHEIGHVAQRHTTRMLVEQGVLQAGLGLALGDVSGLLAAGSSALTGLAYQRSHEREADCHALRLMARAGLATAPTAALLLAISRPGARATRGQPQDAREGSGEGNGWWTLLSSHPDTAARAAQLRAGQSPQCS